MSLYVPVSSAFRVMHVNDSSRPLSIPQGGSENMPIYFSNPNENGVGTPYFVAVDNLSIITPDGQPVSGDWCTFTAYPPLENFEVTVGGQPVTAEANLYLENMDDVENLPETMPENVDIYIRITKEGVPMWAPARQILINIALSDDAPRGTYRLSASFRYWKLQAAGGETSMTFVTSTEVKPYFTVEAPPPPPPPLPVWATILVIVLFVGLAAVLAYAIWKKKI